jgi:tRNA A37 threonylcarbamoyladenosine synthetase subunit TsaC/SUA5/YrdC
VYLCAPEPLGGSASTVVELLHDVPRVLRRGAVSERDVLAALREHV